MSRQPAHIKRDESFRDAISTVDKQGRRVWVYPKKPKGRFMRRRQWVAYALLLLLLAGPWIRIQGEPLMMVNIIDRRFVFFGQVFWPQDFLIFVLAFLAAIVFITLFTVAFGRIFCGWICPQTIFMEHVFRQVEYWIEGDWKHQQALNKAPWSTGKTMRKVAKHAIFFAISFIIGNTFLGYIVGGDELVRIITDPPSQHLGGLLAMLGFSGAFYGNFAFFREQACVAVCPYGRLQGVLLDRKSIVIAYDHVRGEPRGRWRNDEVRADAGKGDCIDCRACVHVCPTGIDIRNGTQLECINCTACIDACDHIMDSVGLPRGLIRYASEAEISDKKPFRFTLRMQAYAGMLTALVAVLVGMIAMRSDTSTTLLRTPGMLYQERPDGTISNLYALSTVNKTPKELPIRLQLEGMPGEVVVVGKPLVLAPGELASAQVFIIVPKEALHEMKTRVLVGVYTGDRLLEKVATSFVGPLKPPGA